MNLKHFWSTLSWSFSMFLRILYVWNMPKSKLRFDLCCILTILTLWNTLLLTASSSVWICTDRSYSNAFLCFMGHVWGKLQISSRLHDTGVLSFLCGQFCNVSDSFSVFQYSPNNTLKPHHNFNQNTLNFPTFILLKSYLKDSMHPCKHTQLQLSYFYS